MCPKLAPQARDRQATDTGLFDSDRFDMIATGVLLDHLKFLYQPLNRYTSLLTETEIFVDTRKAVEDAGASPGLVIDSPRATLPEPPVMRAGTGNQRKRQHLERADIDCDRRREDFTVRHERSDGSVGLGQMEITASVSCLDRSRISSSVQLSLWNSTTSLLRMRRRRRFRAT